jgi:hypothetical protein
MAFAVQELSRSFKKQAGFHGIKSVLSKGNTEKIAE